jgi:hypothetical protein
MSSSRLERLAPLTGAIFTVIFYVSVFGGGDTPDADEGTAKVVKYWSDNETQQIITAAGITIAIVLFVWFAGTLRSYILEREGGSGRLATTVYAGALLFSAGALVSAGITFATADTAGDIAPAATQAMSALESDLFLPMVGGLALLYLATAVVTLRTAVLPKWLGWVSLLLGIVALTPIGWVPFLITGLWVLAVSVIVYRAQAPATTSRPPATPAAAA